MSSQKALFCLRLLNKYYMIRIAKILMQFSDFVQPTSYALQQKMAALLKFVEHNFKEIGLAHISFGRHQTLWKTGPTLF